METQIRLTNPVAVLACMLMALSSACTAGVVLPAGTELEVRLRSKVASNTARAGDLVEAVLIRPVVLNESVVLPSGLALRAKVISVSPAGPEKRATLELGGWTLVAADNPIELPARVVRVDNARESVNEMGVIVGILASETPVAKLDRAVGRVSERYERLGGLLETVKGAVFKEPDPEIAYEPGTEMILALAADFEFKGAALPSAIESPQGIEPAEELYDLVNRQPLRTTAAKTPRPSDLTNLMFLGSEEQLSAAFQEAGWSAAARLDVASGLETLRAVAEARGYKEAPMSTLLLDGKPPDLEFQKQLNTFAMRHHLRIWRRPDLFQGRPVWVCAATHDIGIEFSAQNRTFIHKIDPEIDKERAKVVTDLVFTGRVAAVALVERPGAPRESMNATGDKLVTDGRMAVLLLR